MAEITYTVTNNLRNDTQGRSTVFDSRLVDAKKEQVNLYLDIDQNAIPYSDFGNNLMKRIFKSNDEDEILDLANEVINALRFNYNLLIIDYNVIINNDEVTIKITLDGDYSFELNVNNFL